MAGDVPGVATCPVFCTLNLGSIKHLSDGQASCVRVSVGSWVGTRASGEGVETSSCCPGLPGQGLAGSGLRAFSLCALPVLFQHRSITFLLFGTILKKGVACQLLVWGNDCRSH